MKTIVFDNSPLSHFARAGHLDVLDEITKSFRRCVTRAVKDEIAQGVSLHSSLAAARDAEWLEEVSADGLEELGAFAEYARRLGSGVRDVGEAATLAWAETHGAIAIIDEEAGRRHGRERSVEVHGSLWLITNAIRAEKLTENEGEELVGALVDTQAAFPCDATTFLDWARENGLL